MKNVCTYETALALKAAGFPQPEPDFGQFWYDNEAIVCIGFGDFSIHFPELNMDGYVYAPTAEDILRELGTEGIALEKYSEGWRVLDLFTDCPAEYGKHQDCAAEACAAAWMKLKRHDSVQL